MLESLSVKHAISGYASNVIVHYSILYIVLCVSLKYDALCAYLYAHNGGCCSISLHAKACTHTHTDCHTVYGSWANCTSILSGSLVGICATMYFKKALVHTQVTVAYVHLEGGLRWKLSKSKTLLGHLDHIAYSSFYVAMCIWYNIIPWTIFG